MRYSPIIARLNLLRRILWSIAAVTLAAGAFWNVAWFTGGGNIFRSSIRHISYLI